MPSFWSKPHNDGSSGSTAAYRLGVERGNFCGDGVYLLAGADHLDWSPDRMLWGTKSGRFELLPRARAFLFWSDMTDVEQTLELAERIKPILAGHEPYVQSAVLAELLSVWLAGWFVADSKEKTRRLRRELLDRHIKLVWKLVKENDPTRDDELPSPPAVLMSGPYPNPID